MHRYELWSKGGPCGVGPCGGWPLWGLAPVGVGPCGGWPLWGKDQGSPARLIAAAIRDHLEISHAL